MSLHQFKLHSHGIDLDYADNVIFDKFRLYRERTTMIADTFITNKTKPVKTQQDFYLKRSLDGCQ